MGKGATRGFTLIEMMIVVVIVGVLATLAVVGYRKIVQSAHVSEATGMVQNIRVAQEAYRSETQQYASPSANLTDWYPQSPAYGVQTAWGGSQACTRSCTPWANLPLHIDGPVLFGYASISGTAGNLTQTSVTYKNATATLPASSTTDWYAITAAADLDGNTSTGTLVVGASWTNQLSIINEGQ